MSYRATVFFRSLRKEGSRAGTPEHSHFLNKDIKILKYSHLVYLERTAGNNPDSGWWDVLGRSVHLEAWTQLIDAWLIYNVSLRNAYASRRASEAQQP